MNAMTTVNCIKKDTTYNNDTVTKCGYLLGSLVPRAPPLAQKTYKLKSGTKNQVNFWQ